MNIINTLLFRFKWWWYRNSLPSEGEEGYSQLKQAYQSGYELNVLSYENSTVLILGPILFIYITICSSGKYGWYHPVLILLILVYILYKLLTSFQNYGILNWEEWVTKQILPKEQYSDLANFKSLKLEIYKQDVARALERRFGRVVNVESDSGEMRVSIKVWKPEIYHLEILVWANPVYLWTAVVLGDSEKAFWVNLGGLIMAGGAFLLYDFKERGEKLLQELVFYEQNKIHRLDFDAKAQRGREMLETFRHSRIRNQRKVN